MICFILGDTWKLLVIEITQYLFLMYYYLKLQFPSFQYDFTVSDVVVIVTFLLYIRKAVIQHLIQSFQRSSGSALAKTFRVNYKRHVLTMDDLGTLYGQNWLNDQVLQYKLKWCYSKLWCGHIWHHSSKANMKLHFLLGYIYCAFLSNVQINHVSITSL